VSNWFRTYGFGQILPELLIGAYPVDESDVGMLEWIGVRHVLNLVEDAEYRPGERASIEKAFAAAGIDEERLELIDYGGLPLDQLDHAVATVNHWIDTGTRTYLHCRAGWQRSAAVAAGVVALRKGLCIDDALDFVQSQKPSADPLPHQRDDLRHWWERRGGQPARRAS
jgi:protein-tyrosine phosphatase